MAKPSVYILSKYSALGSHLQKALPRVPVEIIDHQENDSKSACQGLASQLEKAEVLLADGDLIRDNGLFYNLPSLKWMQCTWAGVETLTSCLDDSKPIPEFQVTRFAGKFGQHMSEYVIAHIVAHERNFHIMREQQKKKTWDKDPLRSYRLLSQLSIGILGIGAIGKHVAESCKHFGMTVWGLVNSPVTDQTRCPHVDYYKCMDEVNDILINCDYIVNILPSTTQTRKMLSGDKFSLTTKKPVFINIGRGNVTDEASIINALSKGWLSHAVLDVFEEEPLPKNSKLWEHPQVDISPHISAESFDWQIAEVFVENYERYCNGQPLHHTVNWTKGY